MSKTKRNAEIITEFDQFIADLGLAGRLELDPIPNTFKRRPHFYTRDDGVCCFTAYMWDLNGLDKADCTAEIHRRVDEAVRHFSLNRPQP